MAEQQQGNMSDEELAWMTVIIIVGAALMIAVIVATRIIMSHVAVGSGIGIPIFLGVCVGLAFGVVSYLALRAGAGRSARAQQAPPQ